MQSIHTSILLKLYRVKIVIIITNVVTVADNDFIFFFLVYHTLHLIKC